MYVYENRTRSLERGALAIFENQKIIWYVRDPTYTQKRPHTRTHIPVQKRGFDTVNTNQKRNVQ